jgi:hypothetical protein
MMPRISPAAALLLSASAALFTSCRKPEIRVYLAPKDPPPQTAAAHVHNPNDPNDRHDDEPAPPKQPERPKPKITFTRPEGWTEAPPGEISLAAFVIKGEGAEAAVNITPLPDLRGREGLVVNMYRQQTGLPPIEQEDLGKTLQPVEVAGGEGQLLELLGKNHDKPTRLITVIAHRDGRSWFYRISGDDAFVTQHREAFLAFLKTVQISEPEPVAESATPPSPATPAPATPEAAPKAQP